MNHLPTTRMSMLEALASRSNVRFDAELSQFYSVYLMPLTGAAMRVLHNRTLAEDIAQEVVIKVICEKTKDGKSANVPRVFLEDQSYEVGQGRFRSFLSRTTRHAAIDVLRRTVREQRAVDDAADHAERTTDPTKPDGLTQGEWELAKQHRLVPDEFANEKNLLDALESMLVEAIRKTFAELEKRQKELIKEFVNRGAKSQAITASKAERDRDETREDIKDRIVAEVAALRFQWLSDGKNIAKVPIHDLAVAVGYSPAISRTKDFVFPDTVDWETVRKHLVAGGNAQEIIDALPWAKQETALQEELRTWLCERRESWISTCLRDERDLVNHFVDRTVRRGQDYIGRLNQEKIDDPLNQDLEEWLDSQRREIAEMMRQIESGELDPKDPENPDQSDDREDEGNE